MFGMAWVDIFGNTSVFLLFAWFCSAVLENRWPIWSTLSGMVVYGAALPILSEQPFFVDNVPSALRYVLVMLSFWLYAYLCFEGTFKEKLLTYCLGYTIINVCQIITANLMSMFEVDPSVHTGWLMAISSGLAWSVMYMVTKIWTSVSTVLRQKRSITFFLLPVCQFALIALVVFLMSKSTGINYLLQTSQYRWTKLCIAVVFLLSLVADGMVIDNVTKIAQNIQDTERLKALEMENELTYDYIKAMESDITEMRRYRHDFINILSAVQTTMENGSDGNREALALVRQATSEIGGVTGKHYCDCTIINCILALEEKKLTEAGIKCDLRAEVGEKLRVNELDLCRVMTNLFDNAREACARLPQGRRSVSANVRIIEGYLYVTVRNSHSEEAIGTGHTKKQDKKLHGQGIKILQEITARHGGELLIDQEPDAVTVTATFRVED